MSLSMYKVYLAICLLALTAFSYAEYKGYLLTGSDESGRSTSSGGQRIHHK